MYLVIPNLSILKSSVYIFRNYISRSPKGTSQIFGSP